MERKDERLSWLNRTLLQVMGPAQVGPYDPPVATEPIDETCSHCGQVRSLHEVVREPGLTYSHCPEPTAERPVPDR